MSMIEEKISPMLASPGNVFDSSEWIYEIKWDGSRTLAFLSSKTRLQDRRLVDISHQFPDLMKLNKCINSDEAILDGELIVLKDGKPSYRNIMSRKHQQNSLKIDLLSKSLPAMFVTWDILYMDGKELIGLPLIERKRILDKVVNESDIIKISDFIYEHGKALFDETGRQGLEGVMAKKADSKYYIGKRSRLWLKLKHFITINAVILGYRTDKISLILGLYDENDKIVPIGSVESGISQIELKAFIDVANDIKTNNDFYHLKEKNIQWIKPAIVCKVKFMEWSENFKMRAPSFIEFVYDVKPEECSFV
ncbi:non-homologous end-joining DNA ligase [Thermoanaerobacterium sp. RBIITD]|uniref:non-homologous end-joining DNA ligase n=1 Tax=Thermoanaerobacterium sp. RBIITD TaxID=1550240 RepID=UPI000BB967FA|nr:non-homologous end-joining DNA ligase [Thermoanaerobacterium sp. RBIITD]SNX54708.1 bifunctional non-homologous end joining protein LigD [Thermoanaerobacterium sp. RBIITD]